MDDDDLDRDIRDLLHHPPRESAQERAIAFAQRRLDRDMQEAARLRRGATRRKVGRTIIATALMLLLAAAVATATDSHFLRQVLGRETPLADRVGAINGSAAITPTIDRFGEPGNTTVDDRTWSTLVRAAAASSTPQQPVQLTDKSAGRVLLDYEDGTQHATITAAPGTSRSVCFAVTGTVEMGQCTQYFTAHHPLTPVVKQTANGWAVAGLVADEVVAVSIELVNGQRTALLRNNAFFWENQDRTQAPRAIIAELANGDHRKFKLASPTAARPDRPTP